MSIRKKDLIFTKILKNDNLKKKEPRMKISDYNEQPERNNSSKQYENKLEKQLIEDILFKDIEDDNTICKYAIVFGTSRIIEMKARIKTVYALYKEKRIKKIYLSGSNNGISSIKNNQTPNKIVEENSDISKLFEDNLSEAERMKKECLKFGIKEDDIIIDKESNNSLESLKNMRNNIDLKNEKSIILVTSAYHMRRCILGAIKYISPSIHYCPVVAETGYFEKDNYQNTTLGIQLANFDANHILKQAREGIIAESDEENYQKKK